MKPVDAAPSVLGDLIATRETPHRPGLAERKARPRAGRREPPVSREQRSLFGEILDWMFAPLLLLWPLSVAVTFLVARSLADVPFDRSLADRTLVLLEHVKAAAVAQAPEPLAVTATHLLQGDEDGRAYFQIIDTDGTLIAGDPDLPRPRLYDFPEVAQVKLRNAIMHSAEFRVAYAYLLKPSPAGGPSGRWMLVQVGETLERRSRLANEIIKGVIFPQFLILPLALGLVWFGLSRGLAPLKSLQHQIRARRPDDLSPIDPRGAPEEIAPLVDAFNDLLARQALSLGAQKRFIADAAHQMKTPLAGLRTQAELAMRESDPKQLQRSLMQLVRSAARTARLVSQLLSLARTENLHDAAAMEALDLRRLVRALAPEWADEALTRRIDFGIEDDEAAATISGQPILLRELVANLIDNALRYTPERGIVTVRTFTDADEIVLQVEDDGTGIPAIERDMVFERFYRMPGAPGDGSGLGLSIVREIAAQHGARVEIDAGIAWPAERGHGAGTRISVRFPKPGE
ncbi:MAG: sensor histidine kinase N-terminal domain-containing protein [Burkholderiaceae bacterium]|nr:sensor histidine kinase N-terminal domain-containing protein [Burkholderiaceae bacterium]MEB2352494.1 sensor histidine kinase N-terminal domain-containing protein [Burkholderiaceae bacterium]